MPSWPPFSLFTYRLPAFCLLLSLFLSTALMAQTAPPDESEITTLDDTVIEASRIDATQSNLTSAATIIDSETLDRQSAGLVVDAIKKVPGVSVRRSGGVGSQVSIFTRGTDSDHTLVLFDGIKVMDPSTPNGTPSLDHFMISGLSQIEVLRGPQSSLWGSDAIGGVIHMNSLRGEGPLSAAATFEAGSGNTYRSSTSISGSTETTNFAVSTGFIYQNQISTRAGDPENDSYTNLQLSTSFGILLGENGGIDFVFHAIDAENEFDASGAANDGFTDTLQFLGKIEPYVYLMEERLESRLRITNHSVSRDSTGTSFSLPSLFEGHLFTADWQNTFTVNQQLTLVGGVNYEREEALVKSPFSNGRPEQDSFGFYFNSRVQPLKNHEALTITGSARVENYDASGWVATGQAGVRYEFPTNTAIRGSVGRGYNVPTLNEQFSSFGANPNLEPETAISFELGAEQQLIGQMIHLEATYFYNRIDNLIVGDPITFTNVNIDETVTNGVELIARVIPCPYFMTQVSYTYTDTEVIGVPATFGLTEGSRLLRRPLHELSLVAESNFNQKKGHIVLGYHLVGARDDLDPVTFTTVTNQMYQVVDFYASYEILKDVKAHVRVENAFDADYQDVLGFNSPGLTLTFGITGYWTN